MRIVAIALGGACALLLSLAGIVIYALLALISHLALRRWHESALGKEN